MNLSQVHGVKHLSKHCKHSFTNVEEACVACDLLGYSIICCSCTAEWGKGEELFTKSSMASQGLYMYQWKHFVR